MRKLHRRPKLRQQLCRPHPRPSGSVQPSHEPSTSRAPSGTPSLSSMPSTTGPSLIHKPSAEQSSSVVPSERPSLSQKPSERPTTQAPTSSPTPILSTNSTVSCCPCFNSTDIDSNVAELQDQVECFVDSYIISLSGQRPNTTETWIALTGLLFGTNSNESPPACLYSDPANGRGSSSDGETPTNITPSEADACQAMLLASEMFKKNKCQPAPTESPSASQAPSSSAVPSAAPSVSQAPTASCPCFSSSILDEGVETLAEPGCDLDPPNSVALGGSRRSGDIPWAAAAFIEQDVPGCAFYDPLNGYNGLDMTIITSAELQVCQDILRNSQMFVTNCN